MSNRFIFYNPNPHSNRVGDCTVRALCKATGKSWDFVHTALCAISNADGNMPSANIVRQVATISEADEAATPEMTAAICIVREEVREETAEADTAEQVKVLRIVTALPMLIETMTLMLDIWTQSSHIAPAKAESASSA